MADDRRTEPDDGRAGVAGDVPPSADFAPPAGQVDWSNLWQVPTILLSIILIAAAMVMTRGGEDPGERLELHLTRAEKLIEQQLLTDAEAQLRENVEPHLEAATIAQQGRFHRAVADWLALRQEESDSRRGANHTRVVEQYTLARDHGVRLDAIRLERLANALIAIGNIDRARQALRDLDALDDGTKQDVRERRGRVFRRIVEHEIANSSDKDIDGLMKLLADYRGEREDDLHDLIWVICRQADLRLRARRQPEAIEHLLVDLRHIEYQLDEKQIATKADDPPPDLGEPYTLLGRAYFELGRYEHAAFNLAQALDRFSSDNPSRGEALVLLGRIAFARGDIETASDRFDEVVREFIATQSHLLGILGRAEANSVLGYHDESRADYQRLAQIVADVDAHPGLSREIIARSLIDRHDAAITTGDLELALSYAQLAERFFARPDVPSDVLSRIAATSRQLADNRLARSRELDESDERALALQREANQLYQQAGDYFVRHARSLTGAPTDDRSWAESLWLGARAYDHAGLHELAIKHLEEYLAGRSPKDPRRAEVNLRLAQAHHALQNHEAAARYYRQVIDEHPRSIEATQSFVPLARTLVAIGRRPEAEQLLGGVIAGLQPVQPDAADYRNALIELGLIHYQGENFRAAIERLDEAVKRYPEDSRHTELLFRLGDSYRRLGLEVADRIREPSAESPGERRRLGEMRVEHLTRAFELFDQVCDLYDRHDQQTLDQLARDMQRQAYLYRADCAFDLGRYEQAVQLYDRAARRYADHHSSMHALVQIVNAYVALGERDRARAAHRRALSRLQQLRDDAFNAPDAIMDRRAWERWLEHSPVGATRMTQVTG